MNYVPSFSSLAESLRYNDTQCCWTTTRNKKCTKLIAVKHQARIDLIYDDLREIGFQVLSGKGHGLLEELSGLILCQYRWHQEFKDRVRDQWLREAESLVKKIHSPIQSPETVSLVKPLERCQAWIESAQPLSTKIQFDLHPVQTRSTRALPIADLPKEDDDYSDISSIHQAAAEESRIKANDVNDWSENDSEEATAVEGLQHNDTDISSNPGPRVSNSTKQTAVDSESQREPQVASLNTSDRATKTLVALVTPSLEYKIEGLTAISDA